MEGVKVGDQAVGRRGGGILPCAVSSPPVLYGVVAKQSSVDMVQRPRGTNVPLPGCRCQHRQRRSYCHPSASRPEGSTSESGLLTRRYAVKGSGVTTGRTRQRSSPVVGWGLAKPSQYMRRLRSNSITSTLVIHPCCACRLPPLLCRSLLRVLFGDAPHEVIIPSWDLLRRLGGGGGGGGL